MDGKEIAIPVLAAAGSAGAGAGAAYAVGDGFFGPSGEFYVETEDKVQPDQTPVVVPECKIEIFDDSSNLPSAIRQENNVVANSVQDNSINLEDYSLEPDYACLKISAPDSTGSGDKDSRVDIPVELFITYAKDHKARGLYLSTKVSNASGSGENIKSTPTLKVTNKVVYFDQSGSDKNAAWKPTQGFVFEKSYSLASKTMTISVSGSDINLSNGCSKGECDVVASGGIEDEEFKWVKTDKSNSTNPISIKLGEDELTGFGMKWDNKQYKDYRWGVYDASSTGKSISPGDKILFPKIELLVSKGQGQSQTSK